MYYTWKSELESTKKDSIDKDKDYNDKFLKLRVAEKEIVFAMRFSAIYRVFKDNWDWRTTGTETEFQFIVSAFIDV